MERIFLIYSLSGNLVDDMPMWAHYSNNHKGFCVEYDVLNAKSLFPISYEEDRVGSAISPIKVGLIPSKIYIGSQCTEENKKKLIDTAKLINVNIYQMYLDDQETKYKLKYRML